jgi:hypothetical protein
MPFGMVTVVVSTATLAAGRTESGTTTVGLMSAWGGTTGTVDDAVDAGVTAESGEVEGVRTGFATGNSTCDSAITTIDRKSARKNRLFSIHGTGS